jgi:hypothetical protein
MRKGIIHLQVMFRQLFVVDAVSQSILSKSMGRILVVGDNVPRKRPILTAWLLCRYLGLRRSRP